MIVGVIKTKDLFLHPVEVFQCQGFRGYFRLLSKAFSRKDYRFVDFLEITSRHFSRPKRTLPKAA